VADDLGVFEIDADKVAASVINLLTNAIKFTPDDGNIALFARLTSPDEAEIRIADRGIGLEPRAVNRLFQPFFTQFDSSLHSSGDFGFNKRGLGLGLSIVKQFIELHGGRVHAESTLGEGTSVSIFLPRRSPLVLDHVSGPHADVALTIPKQGGRE
jgi:signal transduction histidine kinase